MGGQSKYEKRGVSHSKDDVHHAVRNLDKGLFPNAFCKILPDIVGNEEDHCVIMHADGAGTKSSLAYIYWKETGDLSVWRGIAQDAIVMNVDDLLCVGCVLDYGPVVDGTQALVHRLAVPVNADIEYACLCRRCRYRVRFASRPVARFDKLVECSIVGDGGNLNRPHLLISLLRIFYPFQRVVNRHTFGVEHARAPISLRA